MPSAEKGGRSAAHSQVGGDIKNILERVARPADSIKRKNTAIADPDSNEKNIKN